VNRLAFWATCENYATQASLSDADDLAMKFAEAYKPTCRAQCGGAYQEPTPTRLRRLQAETFWTVLNLLPLAPDQFGSSIRVSYPALAKCPYSRSTDGV